MLTGKDLEQISAKGISEEQIKEQLACFASGYGFIELIASASKGNGLTVLPKGQQYKYVSVWNKYVGAGHRIVKFVPASGAASRMFKDLYAFLDSEREAPATEAERRFFNGIYRFAFFKDLANACIKTTGRSIEELILDGQYKAVIKALLGEDGLNYGKLPKALIKFHRYNANAARTAMEEHLVEADAIARNRQGDIYLHFTVSPEHEQLFKELLDKNIRFYENLLSRYHISFSRQKESTDTIAVDMDNNPFRNADGSLVFRPGGHGALIENMNDLDCDIVMIKNIDNVSYDYERNDAAFYKKMLGGILVTVQKQVFSYLKLIESGGYTREQIEEMIHFLHNTMYIRNTDLKNLEDAELILYIRSKLNRPIRVCGMVRNDGEPGGGPFIARNQDGTVSPQILESSQIDLDKAETRELFDKGTHFNPVDLVCAVRDYNGNSFKLTDYVDRKAGFISIKSKDGRELKALELPGLWNGGMSDWNTIFVEVPIETFTPVKTVNDLLRCEHQPI